MTEEMKINLIISLTFAAIAAIMLTTTAVTYAEHQPRPDHADETIDNNLDDSCPNHPGNDASEGRACHGLEEANNAATK